MTDTIVAFQRGFDTAELNADADLGDQRCTVHDSMEHRTGDQSKPDRGSESTTSPRICVVQINVSDMDQAIDFYTNVLGFNVKSRASYPFAVVLDQESFTFLLAKCEHNASVDYPDVAQTLINIETTDLAGMLRDLQARGVDLVHAEPQPCPPGFYAAFRDPFGNVLEYLQYTNHT